MTANLIPQDWALKTQALFHCHGKFSPLSPSSNEEDGETTNISAGNSKGLLLVKLPFKNLSFLNLKVIILEIF
jgi:hypothetical protein